MGPILVVTSMIFSSFFSIDLGYFLLFFFIFCVFGIGGCVYSVGFMLLSREGILVV